MRFSLQSLLLAFVVVWSALAAFGLPGILVAVLMVAIAVDLRRDNSALKSFLANVSRSDPRLSILTSLVFLVFLVYVLSPSVGPHPASRRAECMNNLKQLGLALHNYHDTNGCFPPAYIADAEGKPMHSWRLLLLPFLDANSLYQQYSLDERWNAPNNKKIQLPVQQYICPSDPGCQTHPTHTTYAAVVGPNTAWPGGKSLKVRDISPCSKTIMLVEVANSGIEWMEPRDLTLAEAIRAIKAGQHWRTNGYFYEEQPHGANVLFADGSVRSLPANAPAEFLEALLTVDGGKTVTETDFDRLEETYGTYPEPRLHWRHIWTEIAALLVLAVSYAVLLFRPKRRDWGTSATDEALPSEGPGEN